MVYKNKTNLIVNLGCGKHYLNGFINVDGNLFCKKDLFLDLRMGLPFKENSARLIYLSHVLEHFYFEELQFILKEIYRVLSRGGITRILVPDLGLGVRNYLDNHYNFFSAFPEDVSSIGGRLVNFLFCNGQHKIAFDFDYLKELLMKVGFKQGNIKKLAYAQTVFLSDEQIVNALQAVEQGYEGSLFVEAIK